MNLRPDLDCLGRCGFEVLKALLEVVRELDLRARPHVAPVVRDAQPEALIGRKRLTTIP